ncbi:Stp1/IreP family PP2C-type Ser/Thr phosphatase [Pelotomaculum propionicicum]|uniref:Stp1/IreP family PP2C-type Ser/Thr phosphatase n=1 Tax=Pelotomaculum propionicicum TaxID=258475 RepID=UPI003B7DF772
MKRIFNRKKNSPFGTVLSAEGLTDCGLVRNNNEDSFIIIRNSGCSDNISPSLLCAVADGMGGKDYGELASSKAVEILQHEFNQIKAGSPSDWKAWLQKSFLKAHLVVAKKSGELKIKGAIGTTLVALVIAGEKAVVANVGDSRAYLFRGGDLQQITKDHSLVSLLVEKELIEPDEIYTHPRRSEIMRFLGQSVDLEVDVFEIDLVKGDILMLCSDGLWEMARDPLIKDIMANSPNLTDACTKLIRSANQAGGKDNITVVCVKVDTELVS